MHSGVEPNCVWGPQVIISDGQARMRDSEVIHLVPGPIRWAPSRSANGDAEGFGDCISGLSGHGGNRSEMYYLDGRWLELPPFFLPPARLLYQPKAEGGSCCCHLWSFYIFPDGPKPWHAAEARRYGFGPPPRTMPASTISPPSRKCPPWRDRGRFAWEKATIARSPLRLTARGCRNGIGRRKSHGQDCTDHGFVLRRRLRGQKGSVRR